MSLIAFSSTTFFTQLLYISTIKYPMKKILAVALVSVICYHAISQNKLLTIEDALVKNRTTLATENLKQLQFL